MTPAQPKKSDLPTRAASAVVMVAVAGGALFLGGYVWSAFVVAVALGVLWEWWGLVGKLGTGLIKRFCWLALGVIYIGLAAYALAGVRQRGMQEPLQLLLMVIAVDVGAYFAGRTIGGPKIAPKISPSKTWAGLGGGIVAASLVAFLFPLVSGTVEVPVSYAALFATFVGTAFTAVAQAGDFFESWMKRRAGVKDSGALIPGHGGLFDRTDGLIAVSFALAVVVLVTTFASDDITCDIAPDPDAAVIGTSGCG